MKRYSPYIILTLAIIFAVGLLSSNPVNASAATSVIQECGNGVTPSLNIKWGPWSDYYSFTPNPTKVELRRILDDGTNWSPMQYENFDILATYQWDRSIDELSLGREYIDTNVSNGNTYLYRLVMYRADGTGKVMNAWSTSVKCGKAIYVTIHNIELPPVAWQIMGGNVDKGSQSGNGTAYVEVGGSYAISFTNPDGYSVAYNWPHIRNLEGPTYNDRYGEYTFLGDTDKSIQVMFQVNPTKPTTTLVCQYYADKAYRYPAKNISVHVAPRIIVNWSAVEDASGYTIDNTKDTSPAIDVGSSLSYTDAPNYVSVPYDSENAYLVKAYDSGGNFIATFEDSDIIVGDCKSTINVTANMDGGSWIARTNVGNISTNDDTDTGNALSDSHLLLGGTAWGVSGGVNFTAKEGYIIDTLVDFDGNIGDPSYTGNRIQSSVDRNWVRTGYTYEVGVNWKQQTPPVPNSPEFGFSQSCVGGVPKVTIKWTTSLNTDSEKYILRRAGKEWRYPEYYNSLQTSEVVDDLPNQDATYTYSLSFFTDEFESEVSSLGINVTECLPPAPTEATVGVVSNMDSATWEIKKRGGIFGTVVVASGVGTGNATIEVPAKEITLELVTEDVTGFTKTVTNSDGGTNNLAIKRGDSKSFTVNYSEIPTSSVDITADKTSINNGDDVTLNWSGENIKNCVASSAPVGIWAGNKDPNSSATIVNINTTESFIDFTITCESSLLSADSSTEDITDTVRVTVGIVSLQCSDSVDNDGDDFVDMGDPGCENASDNNESGNAPPPPPPGTRECRDGIDNDNDGKTDHPDDPGCDNSNDASETDPITEPYFQLQQIGQMKIDGYSGPSTPVIIRVVPVNGFNSNVMLSLEEDLHPNLVEESGVLGDDILTNTEYRDGSSFEMLLPRVTRSGTYLIRVNATGGGFTTSMNVQLIVDNPGSSGIEEF